MALSLEQEALADAFFGALEQGSVEGVLACYAPGASIWHNFDQISLTPGQSVAGLELLFGNFAARRYVDVRRLPVPNGFVQQHVLKLKRTDGVDIDWPGCIVFRIENGKIATLEEYVDLATLTQVVA